ncbi:hypothetical protein BOW52_10045 [Solemya elarraichensis gill symbiont]|uniref:Uncharacterized protein n=1 Tax=Solemya elarraichensis gill symbiont TaxID=1918949 RepID=A0A1T2KYE7_9GAMM|nr:hypothetical protein BOW52_10045 [Solemya elarraichensis gill symbiont]
MKRLPIRMRQFKARIARNSSAIVQRIPALHPFRAGAKNAPSVLYARICIAEMAYSGGKVKIHDLIRGSLTTESDVHPVSLLALD